MSNKKDNSDKEKGISKEKAEKTLKEGAEKIKKADLEKVVEKSKEIEEKVAKAGPLEKFFEQVKLLISLIQDYVKGKYRQIPWWTIAMVAFALLYILNPLDLIPDFIPGIGYIDDAAVLGLCLAGIKKDLDIYRKWKSTEKEEL